MNKRSDGKTDITFELRTVANLRRSIKGKMTLFTCTYYLRVRYCSRYCSRHCSHRRIDDVALTDDVELTDDVALTDEVSRSCWTKLLMYCWWSWQHISGRKISRTVHASHRIIFNQTALLFIRVKPCYCSSTWSNRVLLTDDAAQSWASKLFLIRWPWFTPCIYKKGASPPLIGYL